MGLLKGPQLAALMGGGDEHCEGQSMVSLENTVNIDCTRPALREELLWASQCWCEANLGARKGM